MIRHWLFKSEPETFSIDHLSKRPKQTEPWNGVRNFQVRNMLRDDIKLGDEGFFYHSSCQPPGIVGIIKVVKEGYPDDTQWDSRSPYFDARSTPEKPYWYMVDVKLVKKFPRMITLEELRSNTKLKTMIILRPGNRLSITSVTVQEWKEVLKML